MKANLIILRLHCRPQAQLPHLCSPRVSAARPRSKICSKTCLTSGKMTIFFSPPFYFVVKGQGGAGTQVVAVLFFLLEGVKNGTIWCCDFISTCARALKRRGDVGRAVAEAVQCRAVCGLPGDRPVTGHFLWFTTDQVAPHWRHYSCSSVQPWWIID